MAFIQYNPNPARNLVGDCVVRAIAKVTGQDWDSAYLGVVLEGFAIKDMPSANYVWGAYLHNNGFKRYTIPDTCPDCYTVIDFTNEHPEGIYLLAIGSHVVAVENGDYYDTWDSGNEVPIYYWKKEI